jgi:type IV pilus assembly protein PilO
MEEKSFFEKVEEIKMPIRIVILISTVALFMGAFLWFIYIPKTEVITETNNSIEDLDRQLNRAKIERKKLPERRAEIAEVETQFKEALNLLPNTKEIPQLLTKMNELADESDLVFPSFRPQKEKAQEFYFEVPIAIEVRGTYHDIAVFFDKVGQMERIMNIHNVSMKPINDRSTTLLTTCDAVTYRFKGE